MKHFWDYFHAAEWSVDYRWHVWLFETTFFVKSNLPRYIKPWNVVFNYCNAVKGHLLQQMLPLAGCPGLSMSICHTVAPC